MPRMFSELSVGGLIPRLIFWRSLLTRRCSKAPSRFQSPVRFVSVCGLYVELGPYWIAARHPPSVSLDRRVWRGCLLLLKALLQLLYSLAMVAFAFAVVLAAFLGTGYLIIGASIA
jgi:hypothetical protein